MNELEALESMTEETRICVKRIGWQNICMSNNVSADRANFRMIYEQEIDSKKFLAQLPVSTREDFEQLTTRNSNIGLIE